MYNRLDEVNMKRKQAITYIICFILTVILSFAKIKEFTPLSVGLCVALTLVGLNGMVVSTFAVAASCIEFSVASLVYSAAAAFGNRVGKSSALFSGCCRRSLYCL